MRTKTWIWTLGSVLTLAAIGVTLVKVWPLLHPRVIAVAPLDPECDLQAGPCTAVFPDGGRVRFGIEPRPIPVVQPLVLRVRTEALEASRVEVDFSGVDMNMGFNRATLHREGPGTYRGKGILPVCVRARMAWEARVLVQTPEGTLAAPFRFDTVRPSSPPSS